MSDRPITELLRELQSGGQDTLDQLLPMVYDELRRLAGSYLSRERPDHTLQPTALVHEAYLRLVGQQDIEWKDRAHFFGFSARLMREILVEYARSRNRLKRGGGFKTQIALEDGVSFSAPQDLDVVVVNEALTKLEALDDRQARIVEMKFFAGMTIEEIAEVMALSPATVKREWATARLFLRRELEN